MFIMSVTTREAIASYFTWIYLHWTVCLGFDSQQGLRPVSITGTDRDVTVADVVGGSTVC